MLDWVKSAKCSSQLYTVLRYARFMQYLNLKAKYYPNIIRDNQHQTGS